MSLRSAHPRRFEIDDSREESPGTAVGLGEEVTGRRELGTGEYFSINVDIETFKRNLIQHMNQ